MSDPRTVVKQLMWPSGKNVWRPLFYNTEKRSSILHLWSCYMYSWFCLWYGFIANNVWSGQWHE